MARKDKSAIPDAAPEEFNNPFASLQIDNLPLGDVTPPETIIKPASKLGRVVLRKETAHRGGKTVIVIHDFAPQINLRSIEELAKKLRNACGCGGTVKERTIEIQGNQPGKIRELLEKEGFRVAGVS